MADGGNKGGDPHRYVSISASELSRLTADHELWLRMAGNSGRRARLFKADLRGHDLSDRNLEKAWFECCDLTEAKFRGSILTGSRFIRSCVDDATFAGALASEAVFLSAQCSGTTFIMAKLCKASFMSAVLDKANFTGADLTKADFESAVCSGTCFREANLCGVDLTSVSMSSEKFAGIVVNASTKLPDGTVGHDASDPSRLLVSKGGKMIEPNVLEKPVEPGSRSDRAGKWTPERCKYWRSLPNQAQAAFERWVHEETARPRPEWSELPPDAKNTNR